MNDNGSTNRGFFATIPGILTAIAAVLTAVAGLYVGIHGKGGSEETRSQPPIVLNLPTASPQSAPTDSTAVNGGSLRLDNAGSQVSDTNASDLVDQCAAGDEQACGDLLDTLAGECSDGYGLSCDVLYLVSPEGSDYEFYGATCGGRVDESAAGTCEEL